MSAKLTIVFFILICFEIGLLLIVLPWIRYPSWSDNYLLVMVVEKMHWPSLAIARRSGYMKGAVSGLGVLNVLLGVWEIVNFKKTASAIQEEWRKDKGDPQPLETSNLSDNG